MITQRGLGYILAGSLMLLAFASCGKPIRQEAPEQADPIVNSVIPEARSGTPPSTIVGTVDFVDGDVSVRLGEAEWRPAEIGDRIGAEDSIRTGPASSCDLRFETFGFVRLESNSIIEAKTILLSSDRNIASVQLVAGSVACKVTKLAGNDRFEIRTKNAVCGVRGTEFLVKEEPGKPMKVAVLKGKVAVLPPSFDAGALEDKAVSAGGKALVEAVVRELIESAPLVEANEESVVSASDMAESDREIVEINRVIGKELEILAANPVVPPVPLSPATADQARAVPEPATATTPVKIPASVTATLGKFTAKAEALIAQPTPIDAEDKKKLEQLPETVSAAPIAPATTETPVQQNPETIAATPVEEPAPKPILSCFALAQSELVGGLAARGDRFYAADIQGRLCSFASDGSDKKTMQGDGASNENSRPVPEDGALYYAGTAALVGIDASSGSQFFSVPLDSASSGFFGRRPASASGKVYLSSDTGLAAYDSKTGTKSGAVALSEGSDMTPALAGGSIMLVARNGSFYQISATDLSVMATVSTGAVEPIASAPLVVEDRAYFADRKGNAFCVDLSAKAVAWKRQLEPGKTVGVFDDPVSAGQAVLFFGKGTIYALAASDGSPAFPSIRDVAAAPCVLDSTIWYGCKDDTLVAQDAASGKVVARFPSGSEVVGKPAASGGRIAFPLASGSIGILDARRALVETAKR